jgi:hypothetical protein
MTDTDYTDYEWLWEAHYTDGSVIKQSEGYKFKDIDQSRLSEFHMVKDVPLIIRWRPSYKLIHFYRVIYLDYGGPNFTPVRLYCFGYQEKDSKTILVIMPDGGIIVTDDVNKVKVTL